YAVAASSRRATRSPARGVGPLTLHRWKFPQLPVPGSRPGVFVHGERNATMSRVRLRGRPAVVRLRSRRRPLFVEMLEDRCLLDAGQAYAATDILVRLQPQLEAATRLTLTSTESGTPTQISSGLWKIDLAPGVTVADALATYRLDPRVE